MQDKYTFLNNDQDTQALKDKLQLYQSERESVTTQILSLKKDLSELEKRSPSLFEEFIQTRQEINAISTNIVSSTEKSSLQIEAITLFAEIVGARNVVRVEMLEKLICGQGHGSQRRYWGTLSSLRASFLD